MAPTSSIVPIRDPIAERRLYFSMLGLLLIVADFVARVKVERKVLAVAGCVVVAVLALATHARAEVWSSAITLWQDTAQKSPDKMRVHFQLASSYCGSACGGIDEGAPRCDLAVQEYEKTAQLEKPNYNLLVDWAAAYECLRQPENALAKLRQAAAVDQTAHVYTQIAKVYGEQQHWAEALDALSTAEKLEPNYAVTYAYRGLVHMGAGQTAAAVPDFQRALALDSTLQPAKDGLAQAQERLREGK
jgi:tetratricopeptide (TPR) repeat protein